MDSPSCAEKLGPAEPRTIVSKTTSNNNIPEPTKAVPNILYKIGKTPMVRINKIGFLDGIKCNIYGKCEYFNAGGSVKDRIAVRMVEDAEQAGLIKPGDTLIEPTSGNTGIGLALTSAVKGYKCIIVMPERMSKEKVDVLRVLGAEIVRTPSNASFDSPESHLSVANRLLSEIPNSHVLNQYENLSNPTAHYEGTGAEILDDLDGHVDMVVCGVGTGGTISGVAKKVREKNPNCKVIGVEPLGSSIANTWEANEGECKEFEVEGIGYDFVPTVCDKSVVDKWYKCGDGESFLMARRLIKEEGLLCGGSSGAAMSCALIAIKDFGLKEGQNCVVVIPDSLRNYMTKFLSDDWMVSHSFMEPLEINESHEPWHDMKVNSLTMNLPLTISSDLSIQEVLTLLGKEGLEQVPVLDHAGDIEGMVTLGHIMAQVSRGRVKVTDSVMKVIYTQFKQVTLEATLGQISRMMDLDHFVMVVHGHRQYNAGTVVRKKVIFGIVTRIDLLNFITKMHNESRSVTAK